MALDVFDLQAVLTLDDNPFQQALSRANSSVSSFGAAVGQISNSVAKAAGVMAAALGGIAVLGIYNAAKDQSSLAQLQVALTDAQGRAQTSFSAMSAASNQWSEVNISSAKQLKPLEAAVKSTQESLEHAQFVWDNATKTVKGHTEAAHSNGVALAWAKQQYDEATAALAAASGQQRVWTGDLTSGQPAFDMTMDSLKKMAMAFEDSSTQSHIAIQDVEASFLRYGVTTQSTMNDAVQATLNLSAATGDNLASAAMKLGEAYKNPAQELTRLQALGIIFDANTQKQIKSMTAAGDSAGAFQIMLKALNDTYGGAAAAQADTFNGKLAQLTNSFNDLTESIGNALLPILTEIVTNIRNFINDLTPDQVDLFAKVILALAASFTALMVIAKVTSLMTVFGTTILPILGPIIAVIGGVTGAIALLSIASDNASGIVGGLVTSVKGLLDTIKSDLGPIAADIQNFFNSVFNPATQQNNDSFWAQQGASSSIKHKGGAQTGDEGDTGQQWSQVMATTSQITPPNIFDRFTQAVRDNAPKFISDVKALFVDAVSQIFGLIFGSVEKDKNIEKVANFFTDLGTNVIQPITDGITNFLSSLSGADWSGASKLIQFLGDLALKIVGKGLEVAGPLVGAGLTILGGGIKNLVDALGKLGEGDLLGTLTILQPLLDKISATLLGIGALTAVAGVISAIAAALGGLDLTAGPLILLAGAIYLLIRAFTDFKGLSSDLGLTDFFASITKALEKIVVDAIEPLLKDALILLISLKSIEDFFKVDSSGIQKDITAVAAAIAAIDPATAPGYGGPQTPGPDNYPPIPGSSSPTMPPTASVQNTITVQISGMNKSAKDIFDDFVTEAKRRNINLGVT